ncbi:hypothetical protein [Effusibacillus consociatus]|uniref:Uncharacterized protein n=1 Tax=Effusibacillus consociatus TaxID=1117041 RepID=A0ABV9Q5C2_9BACL
MGLISKWYIPVQDVNSVKEVITALAGDFDGAEMSFGFLQWNFGQGTLQPLLSRMALDGHLGIIDCNALLNKHLNPLK